MEAAIPTKGRAAFLQDILKHPFDAPLLLFVVGMDVEVHRRGDAGGSGPE